MENKINTEIKNDKVEAPKKEVSKTTTIGEETYNLDEDAQFFTTDIRLTIQGWNYGSKWNEEEEVYEIDETNFQIQSYTISEDGEYVKKTLRVNKRMTETEINALVGKTYEVRDVEVYNIKEENSSRVNTAYGTDFEDKSEIQSTEDIFEVNTHTVAKVSQILEETEKQQVRRKGKPTKTKEVLTGNIKLQSLVKFGTRFDIKNFVITGRKLEELTKFKGQEVYLEKLEFKMKKGQRVLVTDIMPVKK